MWMANDGNYVSRYSILRDRATDPAEGTKAFHTLDETSTD
jgi:hypothetical protein